MRERWPSAMEALGGRKLRDACAGVVAAPLLLGLRVVHQHHIQPLGRQLLEVAQPGRVQVAPDDAVAQIQNRLQKVSALSTKIRDCLQTGLCMLEEDIGMPAGRPCMPEQALHASLGRPGIAHSPSVIGANSM